MGAGSNACACCGMSHQVDAPAKHFWGGTCHIEVMTERAGVLLFLHISLLSHETALQRMKICSCCNYVWGQNIICNTQLYFVLLYSIVY